MRIKNKVRKELKDERGFTLVEVLIALFIFSLISVGATSALTSSLRGQAQMETRLDEISKFDSLRALLRADMASLTLYPRRDAYGSQARYSFSLAGDALMDFTRSGRANPMNEPRGDLQHVAYFLKDGALVRRSYAEVNPAPNSEFTDREMLDNIVNAEFKAIGYFESQGAQGFEMELEKFVLEAGKGRTYSEGVTSLELKAVKLDLEFEDGLTLTQYFEIGL
jgi:general secretion pathway protein J